MHSDPVFSWAAADLSGRGLFLSDLHAGRDEAVDEQLRLMLAQVAGGPRSWDWICWGGDTFDFLAAGNRAALRRTQWLVDAMRQLRAQGVRQYLIEGNHDFHLDFLSQLVPGLVVVPDGLRDMGRGVALVHGDWHTAGGLYGPMRGLFRSRLMRRMLAAGPHGLIDSVATAWSRTSHEVRGGPPEQAYLNFVAQCLRGSMAEQPSVRVWFSGHIHWPSVVRVPHAACYINGEWAVHRTLLQLDEHGGPACLTWREGALHDYPEPLAQL